MREGNLLKRYQFYELKNRSALSYFLVPYNKVFEIGGGKGALTSMFCPDTITVSETNSMFHNILNKLSHRVVGDFFHQPISLLNQHDLIVGNLPYKYTTKILQRVIESSIPTAIFMIQKQVGDKILDSKLSSIKLWINNHFTVSCLLETIPRSDFNPNAPVEGIILKFVKKQPRYQPKKLQSILRIFQYRRKKLKNVYRILNISTRIYEDKRSEQLTGDQFNNLYVLLYQELH